jgi:hypothetical protein
MTSDTISKDRSQIAPPVNEPIQNITRFATISEIRKEMDTVPGRRAYAVARALGIDAIRDPHNPKTITNLFTHVKDNAAAALAMIEDPVLAQIRDSLGNSTAHIAVQYHPIAALNALENSKAASPYTIGLVDRSAAKRILEISTPEGLSVAEAAAETLGRYITMLRT